MTEDPVMVERMRCLGIVRVNTEVVENDKDPGPGMTALRAALLAVFKDIEVKILEGK